MHVMWWMYARTERMQTLFTCMHVQLGRCNAIADSQAQMHACNNDNICNIGPDEAGLIHRGYVYLGVLRANPMAIFTE